LGCSAAASCKQGVNVYDNPLGRPAETALVIRIDGKGFGAQQAFDPFMRHSL
jgi:hypothetical protein